MYVLQANSVKNRAGDLLEPRDSMEPRVHTSFILIGGIVLGWIVFGIRGTENETSSPNAR